MQAPKIPYNIFGQASKKKLPQLYPDSARISSDFARMFILAKVFFFFLGGGTLPPCPPPPPPLMSRTPFVAVHAGILTGSTARACRRMLRWGRLKDSDESGH